MNEIFNFGNGFITTSILIILIGALNFKTLKRSLPLRVLFCLIIISLIVDVVGRIMQFNGIHNIWLYNTYTLIEYSLFTLFYLSLFSIKRNMKIVIGVFYIMALTVMIIITISQSFHEHLNSVAMGLRSLILICFAALYFKDMLSKLEYDTPWENPFFWINSGILLFFSGGFFIFIFSDYRDTTRMINLWDIHNIIHIIYNILIIIGFWKARKI